MQYKFLLKKYDKYFQQELLPLIQGLQQENKQLRRHKAYTERINDKAFGGIEHYIDTITQMENCDEKILHELNCIRNIIKKRKHYEI